MIAQLYDAYENKMYGIAYSILHNVEQAEDAVQDAFIKLIPHISTIQRIESLKTKRLVVYTIKNIAIDLYRRNRKETELFTKEVEEKVISENQNGVSSVKTIEDRYMITQLLSKLPEKYREIIQYRCFYELSYKEISSLLNISEDVAAKRYERGRRMVKEMIGDEMYG
nr:sigma-70 family RNA polymerase sigma factor [Clostridium punense]